jgi:DNA-binding GntR family transcriptional regulator
MAPYTRIAPSPISRAPTLRDQAYEVLTQAVRENRLKPSERIIESKLAEELQISRGPIREAIARLVAEGLLVAGTNGVRVAPLPSLEDIVDNYSIRGVLQGMAARLAAERITDDELTHLHEFLDNATNSIKTGVTEEFFQYNLEFHELIERASKSEQLQDVIDYLRSSLYKRVSHKLSQIFRVDVAHREHQRICEAIATRDGSRAEQLMKAHIDNARESLLKKFGTEMSPRNDK